MLFLLVPLSALFFQFWVLACH